MHLRDTVTIVGIGQAEADGTTVPAAVFNMAAGITTNGSTVLLTEQLRVIVTDLPEQYRVEPFAVYWKGRRYDRAGAVIPRMRGPRVHHYTIALKAITAGA